MKKSLTNLPLKIASVFLSYIMVLVLAVSVISVAVMGYYGFYFTSKDNIEQDILEEMAVNETYNVAILYDRGSDQGRELEYYYKDSNVYYLIETQDGEKVASNFEGQDIVTAGQDYDDEYIYTVYIADKAVTTDEFSVVRQVINIGYALRYWMIVFAIISLVAFIVLLCYLYCAAGHKAGYSEVKLNYLDLIPTDIYAAVTVVAYIISFIIILEGGSILVLIAAFVLLTLLYFLTLGFTMSVATRIKTKTLFKNTVIYKGFKLIKKVFNKLGKVIGFYFKKLPFIWKTAVTVFGILLVEFFFFAFNSYEPDNLFIGFMVFNFFIVLAVLYVAIILQTIKIGGEKIASGDLEHKIDTKYMVLDFKDFSQNLNSINDGLQKAVNEKMKSELFKTELITNVSHDIKTPLTSIINYVDLLKKEDIQNPNANEYINVLDRQSGRLKKLIEDLVEASKASTGNLKVNLTACDVGVLLSQTVGEFDERFKNAQITPMLKMPKQNVIIKADARHLWRVIDNLLNNICKYSQINTRAYIDVSVLNGKAYITFKNISRYELNISSDELMERFVRGDKSRHTEGSGLGLSIAKSLTELQNGNMNIQVDGDLFKVTLEFEVE